MAAAKALQERIASMENKIKDAKNQKECLQQKLHDHISDVQRKVKERSKKNTSCRAMRVQQEVDLRVVMTDRVEMKKIEKEIEKNDELICRIERQLQELLLKNRYTQDDDYKTAFLQLQKDAEHCQVSEEQDIISSPDGYLILTPTSIILVSKTMHDLFTHDKIKEQIAKEFGECELIFKPQDHCILKQAKTRKFQVIQNDPEETVPRFLRTLRHGTKYKLLKAAGRTDIYQIIFGDKPHDFIYDSYQHIDPQEFFGGLIHDYPGGIPEDYATVLADEIQRQSQRRPTGTQFPLRISAYSRPQCIIPMNWHRSLVQKLLDAGIQVCDARTTTIEHPNLFGFNRDGHHSAYTNVKLTEY